MSRRHVLWAAALIVGVGPVAQGESPRLADSARLGGTAAARVTGTLVETPAAAEGPGASSPRSPLAEQRVEEPRADAGSDVAESVSDAGFDPAQAIESIGGLDAAGGLWQTPALWRGVLLFGLFGLAPALLLMTTSYVRIVVVLGLLKQALGGQQTLPNQVVTAAALMLSFLIMTPVWRAVHEEAVTPYREGRLDWRQAWEAGVRPVRQFMSQQIQSAGNSEDVWLFYDHLPQEQRTQAPQWYDDVPLQVLLPAFLMSELKTAFLIGFRIYLPFLILDFVVASVITAMGLTSLSPQGMSLPFKLLLFVLVDGWRLIIGTLLDSFAMA